MWIAPRPPTIWPPSLWPLVLAVGVLVSAIWVCTALWPSEGLRLVNHSGEVLRNVQVCFPSGTCLTRKRLWPRQSWRLLPAQATPQPMQVRLSGPQVERVAFMAAGDAQLVIGEGGQIELGRPQ